MFFRNFRFIRFSFGLGLKTFSSSNQLRRGWAVFLLFFFFFPFVYVVCVKLGKFLECLLGSEFVEVDLRDEITEKL